MLQVLQKPFDQRSKKEMIKLEEYFQDMEFFKNIVQKQDVDTLYSCFRVM